jgi:metacaspase-1
MTRKALLVGLNHYPDPENTLKGCINDVRQVSDLLYSQFGFAADGAIRLLTDARATTAAIVDRLHWLLDGARAGDVLVFHYSGHGSQVPDRHGDEVDDGLDEIICPYDLHWDDPFTDDDLYAIVKDLPVGVNLTVVLDCCHSGTGLREAAGTAPRARGRWLSAPSALSHLRRADASVRRFGSRAAQHGAILIAGCRSNQVSADAYIDGDYHGALTYFLCKTIEASEGTLTYRDLIERVRRALRANQFEQVPQLEGPAALLRGQVFDPLVELVGMGH